MLTPQWDSDAGCTAEDLRHVYEFHPGFAALPTFECASALPATSLLPLADILPNYDEVHVLSHQALSSGKAFA